MMTSGRALCAKNHSVAAGSSLMHTMAVHCVLKIVPSAREQWVDA